MSRVPLYMHRVAGWEVTNTGLSTNSADFDHLEKHRVQLEEKVARFKELSAKLAALTTSKQETTKEMRVLFREVETLVDFLRTGVRQRYGKESEKLIEFGLNPFRGFRKASAPDQPKPAGPPAP